MSWLRVSVRLPAIAFLTTISVLAIVASSLLEPFSRSMRRSVRNRAYRVWAIGMCWILGVRARVVGKPPTGTFFLVANHLSYVDIVLLAAQLDTTFVAKSDLRSWPIVGKMMAVGDTIFIDRTRKRDLIRVMTLISKNLERGIGVTVFPEGTSGSGERLLPFKPSLLQFAVRSGVAVHYATLSYHLNGWHSTAKDAICWWGDAPFAPHFLELLKVPRFEADLVFGDQPITSNDRKDLAALLSAKMETSFEAIRDQ